MGGSGWSQAKALLGTGLLAVPVLAGSAAYAVSEAFGWHEGLARTVTHARGFYGISALATLVGSGLNLLGSNPITALVHSAIINGVVAVPLLVLSLLVANTPAFMGGYTSGNLSNGIGILTTVAMRAAAVAAIVLLFSSPGTGCSKEAHLLPVDCRRATGHSTGTRTMRSPQRGDRDRFKEGTSFTSISSIKEHSFELHEKRTIPSSYPDFRATNSSVSVC